MNWKLFGTMAALIGVGASVALGQGTSPTIVEANYISNVFGQANFIKNPNAKLNTKDVTASSATVSRSPTTPLVATSEFNVTVTSANGTITWDTRSFDAGMKNQNCEARFTYRGFQSTSKAHVKQGANTVATLSLSATGTDPRIASINFPCGDLSTATTFVITDTSTLGGVNEIGGIYVGLATNQANVAQAETVVIANVNAQNTIPPATYTNVVYQSESLDTYGEYNNSTGVFTAKRAGNYFVAASIFWFNSAWNSSNIYLNVFKNGSLIVENLRQIPSGTTYYVQESSVSISLNVGDTLAVSAYQSDSANRFITSNSTFSRLSISRFPTSSELVVTPERQNVFGGVVYTASQQNLFGGSAISSTYTTFNGGQWDDGSLKGKAALTTTGSGQDLGFSIPNMPVGNYKLEVSGLINAGVGNSATVDGYTRCNFRIYETTTTTEVARQVNQDLSLTSSTLDETRDYNTNFAGVFSNTSVATRNFVLQANKWADANAGSSGICQAYSNTGSGSYNTNITFLLTPLDQPSNSALYVQGPVLGAQTGAAIPSGYLGKSEFGGGTGSGSAVTGGGTVTVNTYSNITPGNYLVRYYAGVQKTGAGTATFYYYSCGLTTSGSATVNWYDVVNSPHDYLGNGGYTAVADIVSSSMNFKLLNVTSTTTYYVRCGHNTNGSGFDIRGGAEFIRLN